MKQNRDFNAEYYDVSNTQTDDIEFYRSFIDKTKDVLELGCGSGRVALPLALLAKSYVGVDLSKTMLELAHKKNKDAKVEFIEGDITTIELERFFDLIIAPFRVLQCFEEPQNVDGFFKVIRNHLGPDGVAIVNVFRPNTAKSDMATKWARNEENECGEYVLANGDILKTYDVRHKLDADRQILYPELIYRRYRNGELIDTHLDSISMRYWYPDEFKQLVLDQGFTIIECWGGYTGQTYGEGSELVIAIG